MKYEAVLKKFYSIFASLPSLLKVTVNLCRNLKLDLRLESPPSPKASRHTQPVESNQVFLMFTAVVLKLIKMDV